MKKLLLFLLIIAIGFIIYENRPKEIHHTTAQITDKIGQGNLILINKETKLQLEPLNLVKIPTSISSNVYVNGPLYIEEMALNSLQILFKAANKDGVKYFKLNSAFRNHVSQQLLYEQNGEAYALPAGYSEHQSGLAVDIGSTEGMMEGSIEALWLAEHAHEYGFVLRYPAHKSSITGISFEPWHYRYVGLPHSVIMYEQDLVLEEYIEKLERGEKIITEIDNAIFQVEYKLEEELPLFTDVAFNISGNNRHGFILTTIKNN